MSVGGKPENLKPVKTTAEAKERGRKGGLAKAKNEQKRKLLSQMYAEFLAGEHEIEIAEGVKKKLSGQDIVNMVSSKVLARGDSSSVRMLSEMRDGTEGKNVHVSGANGEPLNIEVSFKK